ncbi:dTDP-4-dehydrorhamnose 3,5-epimerase [Pontiellaceae bacterium B1224]|nr:dTDP-4-dehydrorhamnose 3,5-epimerase [Pontiellaceae bacterium B1224]
MEVVELAIPNVKLIKPRRFNDDRGFFQQTFHAEQYSAAGIDVHFVQDNWSRSSRGVLRGLHYQYEHAQSKLVNVLQGEVFDVAVDMRKDSPTFGKWVGEILSAENGRQMFVPKGFAHGFMVLSEMVDFIYKCDDVYTPGDEYGVLWNDPAIGIEWPQNIDPLVSKKDAVLPLFVDAKLF